MQIMSYITFITAILARMHMCGSSAYAIHKVHTHCHIGSDIHVEDKGKQFNIEVSNDILYNAKLWRWKSLMNLMDGGRFVKVFPSNLSLLILLL